MKSTKVILCAFVAGCFLFTSTSAVESACENYMADIVFVIDSSGSIRDLNPRDGSYDNWELLLNFMVTMVDRLNIGLNQGRIGVVQFSTEAESVFHMNQYTDKNLLKEAIRRISYLGGHTNTAGGIRIMHDVEFTAQNGDRPGVPNIAIVVADGVSTLDKASTIPEAIRAHNDSIKIYSVGITSEVNEAELRDISSSPHLKDKNYFMVPNFQNLDRLAIAITSEACDNATKGRVNEWSRSLDLGSEVILVRKAAGTAVAAFVKRDQRAC
ncbi:Collagen alpha-5(VI) chain [Lamellibrachia satsuma]|nr:Collagen alpha-5(VI) chain [Lamellibrachia satsuma]